MNDVAGWTFGVSHEEIDAGRCAETTIIRISSTANTGGARRAQRWKRAAPGRDLLRGSCPCRPPWRAQGAHSLSVMAAPLGDEAGVRAAPRVRRRGSATSCARRLGRSANTTARNGGPAPPGTIRRGGGGPSSRSGWPQGARALPARGLRGADASLCYHRRPQPVGGDTSRGAYGRF